MWARADTSMSWEPVLLAFAGMSNWSSAATTGEISMLAVMSMVRICFFMSDFSRGGLIERLYFCGKVDRWFDILPNHITELQLIVLDFYFGYVKKDSQLLKTNLIN